MCSFYFYSFLIKVAVKNFRKQAWSHWLKRPVLPLILPLASLPDCEKLRKDSCWCLSFSIYESEKITLYTSLLPTEVGRLNKLMLAKHFALSEYLLLKNIKVLLCLLLINGVGLSIEPQENSFVTSRHADWVSFSMTLFTVPANNLLINLDNNTILYFSTAFHSGNSKCLASTIKSNIITHR